MPKRPDAELVKTTKFSELTFHIMPTRIESTIYFNTQVDLSRTLDFIEEFNREREEKDRLTLFQLFLTAATRAITFRPKINRFVSGRRLWQRNQIIFSFVVKKEKTDEGEEVNAMVEMDPFDTLETTQKRISDIILEARHGKNKNEQDINFYGSLPRWFIRKLIWFINWMDKHNLPFYFITKDVPMWCSVYIAHLGSIGLDAVYHHLYEMGTASVFITIGKFKKAVVVNQETEQIKVKNTMELRVSIDDRIADGAYTGPAIYLLKKLIEEPEPLLTPPELTNEQLDKLMLKKYKKERLAREKQRKKEKRKK